MDATPAIIERPALPAPLMAGTWNHGGASALFGETVNRIHGHPISRRPSGVRFAGCFRDWSMGT